MKRKKQPRSRRSGASRSGWSELFYFVLLAAGGWLLTLLVWGRYFDMRGVELAESAFSLFGGAIFVPLVFFIYVWGVKFLGLSVPRFFARCCGVATLFFVLALSFSLAGRTYWAGTLGNDAANFLIGYIGYIPSVIAAIFGVFAAAAFFGVPLAENVFGKPVRWFLEKRRLSRIERQKLRQKQELIQKTLEKRRAKPKNVPPRKSLSDEVSIEFEEPSPLPASRATLSPPLGEGLENEPLPSVQEMLQDSLASLSEIPEDARLQKSKKSGRTPIDIAIEMEEIVLPPLNSPLPPSAPEPPGMEIAPEPELPDDEPDEYEIAGLFPPPIEIFGAPLEDADSSEIKNLATSQGDKIVETLQNFGVKADVAETVIGPSVVQFQIQLAPGIRVNKVAGLANDLAMALAVVSVRVEAPIPGKPYVGIEIPNVKRRGVPLRSIVESRDYQENSNVLPLPMGMRVDSRFMVVGLEELPHILVAGTTGSGKSVFTNTCIMGMCNRRTPDELRLILVDPKHVEFAIYDGLPHLLARPISDPKKAVSALAWAVQQMESRSEAFALAKARNLQSYNEKLIPKARLPHIVIVVDELADLMYTSGKEVESLIARLAQKARSAGIHLILATQRPSVDVITGLIKANIPARVAFAVPSQTDSRTIIDTGGADKLLGKGDMLFLSTRYPRAVRLQAAFINEDRTLAFIENLKQSFGEPEYIEFEDFKGESGGANGGGNGGGGSITLDPKIDEALNYIMDTGIASASKLQTIMGIGYPRASRIISTLEQLGILGPQPSSPTRPREILMDNDEAFERIDEVR